MNFSEVYTKRNMTKIAIQTSNRNGDKNAPLLLGPISFVIRNKNEALILAN